MRVGAEAGQTDFVLEQTGFGRRLSYLEIGAWHPIKGNNTYILENTYKWTGFSIDYSAEWLEQWNECRVNPLIVADALTLDYRSFERRHFTYLSCDIDPPSGTFRALKRVIESGITFDVVTFEHDYYTGIDSGVREESRAFMQSSGYELVRQDVEAPYEPALWWLRSEGMDTSLAESLGCAPFEDWYTRSSQ